MQNSNLRMGITCPDYLKKKLTNLTQPNIQHEHANYNGKSNFLGRFAVFSSQKSEEFQTKIPKNG